MEGRKGGRVASRGELEEDSLRGGGDKGRDIGDG